jgi:hypothetical protein
MKMKSPNYLEIFRRATGNPQATWNAIEQDRQRPQPRAPQQYEINETNERIHANATRVQARPGITSFNSFLSYRPAFDALERRCPDRVDQDRWHQAVDDSRQFLGQWGGQAAKLGWSAQDLFGLHQPPEKPHPSYERLSRYDRLGLVWILLGRPVVILTAESAVIKTRTGTVTYRQSRVGDPNRYGT